MDSRFLRFESDSYLVHDQVAGSYAGERLDAAK